jgi:hypothetical protein
MSNAQTASVVSILLGAVLLWRLKSEFRARENPPRAAARDAL